MDRNSLLAFLLIAVIIFLMPEYYKLVYPPPPPVDTLVVDNETPIRTIAPIIENTTPPQPYNSIEEVAQEFSVITDLYSFKKRDSFLDDLILLRFRSGTEEHEAGCNVLQGAGVPRSGRGSWPCRRNG